jgi:hypothetical protein
MRGSFNPIIFRFCQRNLNIKLVLLLPNPATYTRSIATERMTAQAAEMGADAVINVRYMTTSVIASAAELLVYGPAVKLS